MSNNTKSAAATPVAKTSTSQVPATNSKAEKTIKIKTVSDVLEALKETNSKVSYYQSFCRRFDNVRDFKNNLDGSALTLVIGNEQGEQIEFKRLDMIEDFIDKAIAEGEKHRENMEKELLSLTL